MKPRNSEPMEAIAFINNPISQRMLRAAMQAEGIDPARTLLFVLRAIEPQPWWDEFAEVVRYPHKAALSLWGQRRFIGFYRSASRQLKRALASPALKHLFVINNDNILTNHALAATQSRPECRVSVVAEGLMNYQDIQLANRARWRNLSRPVISRLLGLRWQTPRGHLSGAHEKHIHAVYSFAAPGLVSPPDKVRVIPFEPIQPTRSLRADTVLFVETALWQWMAPEQFERFADGFTAWIHSLNAQRLLIKPHPNYPPSEYLRQRLPPYAIETDPRSIEAMAADIDAARVVGFCCTGLITLAKLRPDIQCLDYGHDFYLEHAYRGDRTLLALMESVGVGLAKHGQTYTAAGSV